MPFYRQDVAKQRRQLLLAHVGQPIEFRRAFIHRLGAPVAILVAVNRTRAIIQRIDAPLKTVRRPGLLGVQEEPREHERWTVPMEWLLPPGCLEYGPRQLPRFEGDAG